MAKGGSLIQSKNSIELSQQRNIPLLVIRFSVEAADFQVVAIYIRALLLTVETSVPAASLVERFENAFAPAVENDQVNFIHDHAPNP